MPVAPHPTLTLRAPPALLVPIRGACAGSRHPAESTQTVTHTYAPLLINLPCYPGPVVALGPRQQVEFARAPGVAVSLATVGSVGTPRGLSELHATTRAPQVGSRMPACA